MTIISESTIGVLGSVQCRYIPLLLIISAILTENLYLIFANNSVQRSISMHACMR